MRAAAGYNGDVNKLLLSFAVCLVATATHAVDVTKDRADELLAKLPSDPWPPTRDASALAWGESYNLHGLVDLYEAAGDTKYLDELARRCDLALSHRDDARGVADYSGKVRKAWTMAFKYTVAEATLLDDTGKPAVRLRSLPYAHNHLTEIEVTRNGDTFSIRVTNPQWKRDETFSDLRLDPSHRRDVRTVVNAPTMVPSPKAGTATEYSALVKATSATAVPAAQKLTMTPLPLSYTGYLGIIYHPVLRFAEIVKADPKLASYLPVADRIIKSADEAYDEAASLCWRDGPNAGEGYYIFCERGGPFPWDNLPEPFNYLGGHVSAELLLHKFTGKNAYLDRVTKMANLLKRRLTYKPDHDLYVWNYWYEPVTTTGWTKDNSPSDNIPMFSPAANVEDVSHATLDVQLMLNAARAGIVFDDTDLCRVANTFLKNVVRPDGLGFNAKVDGTGNSESLTRTRVWGWLPLASVDPAVYEACRRIYEHRGEDHFPSLARLLLWEKRLAAAGQAAPGANNSPTAKE